MTRKISRAVAKISLGLQKTLYLGNLDAKRDWGHAKDYVYGMWLMLQQDKPDDYVIATGRMETVRKFIEISAKKLGWGNDELSAAIIWEGKGENTIGRRADTNEIVIRVDKRYFRPTEVEELKGNPTKAYKKLNWEPTTTLEELVSEMIEHDKEEANKESLLKKEGFQVISSMENPPSIKN